MSDDPKEPVPEIDPPQRVLEIAIRVADHEKVDWSHTATGEPALDGSISELRSIAEVAAQFRRPHDPKQSGSDSRSGSGSAPDSRSGSGSESDSESADSPARTWRHLQLIEKLGEGGFGEVWRARDPQLQREVALKLLHEGPATAATRRWLDEARRLARVRHPNVITIHGADRDADRVGIWTDLVRGHDLEQLLGLIGPLGASESGRIGMELCAAVGAVHAAGLVHGDIKLRNIMRTGLVEEPNGAGHLFLMDFGSAREGGGIGPSAHTPYYAAPELLAGAPPTRRSDIYAIGVVLHRLTTGRFPVEADSLETLRAQLLSPDRPGLRQIRPELPLGFARVVNRALEPDPSRRFASVAEMESALASALDHQVRSGSSLPGWRRSLGFLTLGVLIGILGVWVNDNFEEWTTPPFRVDPKGRMVTAQPRVGEVGESTNDAFGSASLNAGDVNGDGFDDFLVAAVFGDSLRGYVTLYLGQPDSLPRPSLRFSGDRPSDSFGGALGAGDLNGDGYADFAIGAPAADPSGDASGRIYVWFGGREIDPVPNLVLDGSAANQSLGYSLDLAGDLNGDGYNDLCTGAPLDEGAGFPTGRAFVFFGGDSFDPAPDLDLTSASSYSQFGIDVATGDFNDDGFDDLVVAANWENTDAPLAGRAYVYFGSPHCDTSADLVLRGPQEKAMLGYVAALGDLDGDGVEDLGVTHNQTSWDGSDVLRVFLGSKSFDARADLTIRGGAADDGFGSGFGSAGDLNRDGHGDLYITAPSDDGATRNAGAIYVYFGGPDLDPVADLELGGKGTWDLFGASVAPFGDPRDSEATGLLVGSSWASDRARRAGRIDWCTFR